MGVLDVYTVLGETTRNPTNTMVRPLDSNVQLSIYLFILQHPLSSIMCSCAVSARIKERL